MSTNGVGKSYDEFIQSLRSRGLQTTSLGNGEANFSDYANALSSGLKEELLQSIGDEAGDAQLQAKVASLFGGKSVMQSAEIISAAKAAGLNVSVEYKSTSYIVDNKQDGNYDKDVTNGSIAIYTFSDGNSTIKIADANGNGALEAEEIFMNEILGGVANDIGVMNGNANSAVDNTQNMIDMAKRQQQELLKQIEDAKKSQKELLDKTSETKEKAGVAGEKDEIQSAKDFEQKILDYAIEKYDGTRGSSLKAILDAKDSISAKYNVSIDASSIDTLELSEQLTKELDKIDEEKEKKEEKESKEE